VLELKPIFSLLFNTTQPTYVEKNTFPNGIPKNSEAAKDNYYISAGSPAENEITEEQLHPFPRCAMHASYIKGKNHGELVTNLMKVGFCFSQPIHVSNDSEVSFVKPTSVNNSSKGWCNASDVWNKVNVYGEWSFASLKYGDLWIKSDPSGVLDAHRAMRKLNNPHEWDMGEVHQLFSN